MYSISTDDNAQSKVSLFRNYIDSSYKATDRSVVWTFGESTAVKGSKRRLIESQNLEFHEFVPVIKTFLARRNKNKIHKKNE